MSKAAPETKVAELYGLPTVRPADWKAVASAQQCPFLNRRCLKNRKSAPEITIGTCTMTYGRRLLPVMICPFRLLERSQIFTDCVHLLRLHEPGNELRIVAELAVPGGSIDYCLVSVRDGKPRDFVGIELQTLDTTGTVWPERQRFLHHHNVRVKRADTTADKPFGMNWKMTAKTILVQLNHKIATFEHLSKRLVLVLQDCLLNLHFAQLSHTRMPKTPEKPGFASNNARFRGPGEPRGDPPTSEIPGENPHSAHEKVAQSAAQLHARRIRLPPHPGRA
jgi:hypothetical protein